MTTQPNSASTGVVIGRFQVPELHVGHRHLIDYVSARHDRVLILIGYNDVRYMPRNELSISIRIVMVQQAYSHATVLPLSDSKISNEHWSNVVDAIITSVTTGEAMLYGSRDSFIPKYSGRYPTHEVPEVSDISGTNIREALTPASIQTSEQRHGWMTAIRSQYLITDSVVDVAVMSPDWRRVLMGRRGPGAPLGFFGGFLDRTDLSDEAGAKREQTEEVTGITTGPLEYVGSFPVDDPRYRGSGYRMMSRFFVTEYIDGDPAGDDDMPVVEWAALDQQTRTLVKSPHLPLYDMLLEHRSQYHTPDWGWD